HVRAPTGLGPRRAQRVFFFQAEDGIRDRNVTGVQTCALPIFASSWMLVPAERASLAPPPGRSSTAWIVVPFGMLRSGRLLPTLMSADGPLSMLEPWPTRFGARM